METTDAGRTWVPIVDDQPTGSIGTVVVSQSDPASCTSAAARHCTGPTLDRPTTGGKTFDRVLYKDENTGGNDVDSDPANPDVVYATLW